MREKGAKQFKKVTKNVIKTKSHTLTDLVTQKEYEAQVTAVNDVGESEPSQTSKPFKLEPESGEQRETGEQNVPSAPGQPTVTDASPTDATLTWEDSTSDGGSPISGYNVYIRENGTKPWKKVTKTVIKKKTHVLTELDVDKEYEAQVTAVNDIGESEPSQASKPFKLQSGAPKKGKSSKRFTLC